MAGVLQGVRVLEISGLGPGPFCGMLLADLGADVIAVERRTPGAAGARAASISQRGKRSAAIDLKKPGACEAVLRLVEQADVMIEGMRPGAMERLGLGPDACLARRPSLVYGRMTGWGQDGPLAQAAGHDGNYVALSGALWYASPPGAAPVAPSTVLGDVAGGALYLAIGLLAGVVQARRTGRGQVVDAAIVDGSAHMLNLLLGGVAGSGGSFARGATLMDGPHWAHSYRCSDGHWIAISPLEPRFYAELLRRMGLEGDARFRAQMDRAAWPAQREALAAVVAGRTRAEWCALLEGTDACFAPVHDPAEAAAHPHMAHRGVYATVDGVLQAAPAPRFSSAACSRWREGVRPLGADTAAVLRDAGFSEADVAGLRRADVI